MDFQIGEHTVRVEEDLLNCIIRGDFLPEDVTQCIHLAERIIEHHGYFFAISDVSKMGRMLPETRRRGAEWSANHPYAGAAFYGASLPIRTIMTLAMNGARLFQREKIPLIFVKTEQEARAFIADCRQRRLAPHPA